MFSALVIACGLAGCAQVDIRPIKPNQVADASIAGARFYQPEPYLLVTASQIDPNAKQDEGGDAPGGGSGAGAKNSTPVAKAPASSMQFVWLPNFGKPYTINVVPGWGTVNGTFTLDSGWNLTSVGVQLDSKIPETITAVTGLLTTAAKVTGAGGAPANVLIEPGLYHIDTDPNGVVTGLTKVAINKK